MDSSHAPNASLNLASSYTVSRWWLILALLLLTPHAAGSFFLHCVYRGEVQAEDPLPSKPNAGINIRVGDAMALPGSHTDCQSQRRRVLRVPFTDDSLKTGELLVLRHQRSDGLCEPGVACAQDHWELLFRAQDPG